MRSFVLVGFALILAQGCGESAQTSLDSGPGRVDSGAAPDAGVRSDSGVSDTGVADTGAVPDAGVATDAGGPADAGGPVDAGPPPLILGGDRPAPIVVPDSYDGTPLPLVILLHGYSVDGATQDFYFGLSQRAQSRGFFLILPDGTREASAARPRFWNATSGCCNFYGSQVDDVAYLEGLIDEASLHYAVDPDRIHFIGHSNGGFMSYRMACDISPRIASIASLAGMTHQDESLCTSTTPMSVLHIHGTLDTTIPYQGSAAGFTIYPSAAETARRWATRAGCDVNQTQEGARLDLDTVLLGDDTDVIRYSTGCATGVNVELWRIVGGGHIPALQADFMDRVLDFLYSNPRR